MLLATREKTVQKELSAIMLSPTNWGCPEFIGCVPGIALPLSCLSPLLPLRLLPRAREHSYTQPNLESKDPLSTALLL